MIWRIFFGILLLGGALITGTGAWILMGVIDLQQNGVLITMAGALCYMSACASSIYGLIQVWRLER